MAADAPTGIPTRATAPTRPAPTRQPPATAPPAPVLLRLHPADDVAIARHAIAAGTDLGDGLTAAGDVPRGHKVALTGIAQGAPVLKYGQVIGVATAAIRAGEHVHGHNLAVGDALATPPAAAPRVAVRERAAGTQAPGGLTFDGITRPDGQVATRNHIAIVSSVNCSATVAKLIAARVGPDEELRDRGVDGVVALTHPGGCGIPVEGEPLDLLRRTLAGYARHPNVGAVLVVGLGCEVNQVPELAAELDLPAHVPVATMTIQEAGGTAAAVREGVGRITDWLPDVGRVGRAPVPVGRLRLGLKCGGSDAYSGITANPSLGAAADLLVRLGGTAILAETPEIYGAEHLLAARAARPEVAEALLARVAWWQRHTEEAGARLDDNPSPGNKAGGLTTIREKSLGAVAKSGTSPLTAVYDYARPVTERGLVFMDTPGYDPVSVTGMVAGGAHVVCFTTGRGSVYGSKPAPTIKLATTSELYRRMTEDMDVDCGPVLDGGVAVEDMGRRILDRIVEVASGALTASERLGMGDEEFAPWRYGVTL